MLDSVRDMEIIHQIVPSKRLQSRRVGVEVGEADQHPPRKAQCDKCKRGSPLGISMFPGGGAHLKS